MASSDLAAVAPAFVEVAHRIVWCTTATASPEGHVKTRVLHPLWSWDGTSLTGWILTSPNSPKARHLATNPRVSLTYWDASHDTCTADCDASWELSPEERQAGWDRFATAPAPVGYDPKIIPQWPDPQAPEFGVLRLEPRWLRVMPGTVLLRGQGEILTWHA
ncbi:MAG TPA: pyridoxamine 5'-phosphate oxidase family protein [Ornithinibacter sp.]|nr:pyridoxamine 5'-phosphate oxidase family protein [Ornithinibacter sp.]